MIEFIIILSNKDKERENKFRQKIRLKKIKHMIKKQKHKIKAELGFKFMMSTSQSQCYNISGDYRHNLFKVIPI